MICRLLLARIAWPRFGRMAGRPEVETDEWVTQLSRGMTSECWTGLIFGGAFRLWVCLRGRLRLRSRDVLRRCGFSSHFPASGVARVARFSRGCPGGEWGIRGGRRVGTRIDRGV